MQTKANAITTKEENNLQQMVDQESQNRKILTEFITSHMQSGTDFGSITIGGKQSKPSLFKAGAEKFASLMKLRADTVKDQDTWEMAGSKAGLFCYKCYLYNAQDKIVGMGLGACSVEEKKSYNNAIKIAKKRAFVDAILTTGALSDFFTQDLEDQMDNPVHAQQAPLIQTNNNNSISEKQMTFIKDLCIQKGKVLEALEEKVYSQLNKNLSELTHDEASKVIETLLAMPTVKKKTIAPPEKENTTPEPEITEDDYQRIDQQMLN